MDTHLHSAPPEPPGRHRIFRAGEHGAAHVVAHRMLNAGQKERGYHLLDRFLEGHSGTGPRWVHLNWHLAVFSVGTHRCERALTILETAVLPGVDAGEALVDGPQLLFRLALSDCSIASELPWQRVADAARSNLGSPDPYTELHNLLALAGGRDIDSLDRWLENGRRRIAEPDADVVERFGRGLRACLAGDLEHARSMLSDHARAVAMIGGSQAQNRLFSSLAAAL